VRVEECCGVETLTIRRPGIRLEENGGALHSKRIVVAMVSGLCCSCILNGRWMDKRRGLVGRPRELG
jgi:hypothetical protein